MEDIGKNDVSTRQQINVLDQYMCANLFNKIKN